MNFKFELGETVVVTCSGERGTVTARSEYVASESQYFVRYSNGQGVAVEQWWGESAIVKN